MFLDQLKRVLGALVFNIAVFSVSVAFAQGGGEIATQPVAPEQPGLVSSLVSMLPMLAICYLIFWSMVIRPQESKVKKHKQLLEGLKRGDSVVTSGGIIGRVVGVEAEVITLEIAPNVKVKFATSHIVGLEQGEKKAEAA